MKEAKGEECIPTFYDGTSNVSVLNISIKFKVKYYYNSEFATRKNESESSKDFCLY